MNFAARNAKINLMFTNQGERKRGTNKFFGKHENAEKICCLILQKTVAMVEYSWVLFPPQSSHHYSYRGAQQNLYPSDGEGQLKG